MNFNRLCLTVLCALLLSGWGPSAPPAASSKASVADLAAMRQTALDYIEGSYFVYPTLAFCAILAAFIALMGSTMPTAADTCHTYIVPSLHAV